jgi:hypothetical protein
MTVAMALNFSNESRSYDGVRHAVRFWGYNQASEISFFITEEALRELMPGATNEADFVKAFDLSRERVRKAAVKVYRRRPQGSYEITARDL